MAMKDARLLLREYGPLWLVWRLWYEAQLRVGFVRTLPVRRSVDDLLTRHVRLGAQGLDDWLFSGWDQSRGRFFFSDLPHLEPAVCLPAETIAAAERIVNGQVQHFSRFWRRLGNPPDWFAGEAEHGRWPSDVHWSRIKDLSPERGDIKVVWEPSRFGQAFALARGYALTGDERYPETFWAQVEHWIGSNPPEQGPHWRCGQEMSLRSLAWIFGLYAFRRSPHSTPGRVARLLKQLWYHAWHVAKVHWYAAECVRNNHAISEAVALFTVGALFPFLPGARAWREKGLKFLEREVAWQIYDDGSYVQHSMNYARLVVQLLTWAVQLARRNQIPVAPLVMDRSRRLLDFLVAMQETESGRLPNYGPNDGALILPLTACDFLDYRPALGALGLALGAGRLYGPGIWDEEAVWLVGPESLRGTPCGTRAQQPASQAFPTGGYYTLRGDRTYAVIRCATLHHRPHHADMLHLDVWVDGQNVLIDPGTYSYNAGAPWSHYFPGTAAHNTVMVDGRDQMRRGPRFMWLDWTRSTLLSHQARGEDVLFEGEHHAYPGVTHRRRIELRRDTYVVTDHLTGEAGSHTYRLHWLLNDWLMERDATGARIRLPDHAARPLRLRLLTQGDATVSWARADEETPRGWQSLYYGERSPAWSVAVTATGHSCLFVTIIGPSERVEEEAARRRATP